MEGEDLLIPWDPGLGQAKCEQVQGQPLCGRQVVQGHCLHLVGMEPVHPYT